jgi:hypothetical protein
MNQRIVGFVVMGVGVVLFIIGLNASDSIGDQMSNFFTGRYSDKTMWYMVGGGALAVGGLALATVGGRWARN